MIVTDFLVQLRREVKDVQNVGYTDLELIQFTNAAIQEVNLLLVKAKDPFMAADITITGGMAVPDDFLSPVGVVPVHINGGLFVIDDGSASVPARYWKKLPYVAAMDDTMPLPDWYMPVISRAAAIFALNRNEYQIDQDKGLMSDIAALLESAYA